MLKTEIEIPEGIEATLENNTLNVKGRKGSVSKMLQNPQVSLKLEGRKITLVSGVDRKKVRAIIGTWQVLIRNMFTGVTKGWKGELKLVYTHFPVKLKLEGGKLYIDNFLGEKSPRTVPVPADMKVEIDKNAVYVSGLDKERVGQVCGRIEQTTKIRGYDKRVFQDGIYITRSPYVEGEDEKQ